MGECSSAVARSEINTELTDVRDNTEIWGHRYGGQERRYSFSLATALQKLAGTFRKRLRSGLSIADKEQVANQGTQDAQAYSLYLKGRYAWNNRTRGEVEKGDFLFQSGHSKRSRLCSGVFRPGGCLIPGATKL